MSGISPSSAPPVGRFRAPVRVRSRANRLARSPDFLAGVGALALAALFAPWWLDIRQRRADEPLGPALLPAAYLIVIAALGAVLVAKAWLRQKRDATRSGDPASSDDAGFPHGLQGMALTHPPGSLWRLRALFVLLLAGYIWVLPAWGFFAATTTLVAVGVLLLRRGRPVVSLCYGALAGALLAGATLFIFGVALLVDLPLSAVDEALMRVLR